MALAVAVLALGWPTAQSWDGPDTRAVLSIALTLAIAAAMFGRRKHPLGVLVLVACLSAAQFPLRLEPTSIVGVLVAVWSLAVERRRQISLPAAIGAGTTCAGLAAGYAAGADRLSSLSLVVSLVCAAWALGAYGRARRQVVAALREKADRLEADRARHAERAVADERARINRDMHDGLGHSLSVIVVQADAARSVLSKDPQRSAAAMEQVSRLAREALAEMRAMVRAERQRNPGDDGQVRDLSRLGALLDVARGGGTEVDVTVDGDLSLLPPGVSAAGFRVVQESLTNVRKHAGAGAHASVVLVVGGDGLQVSVTSSAGGGGRAAPAYPGGDPAPGTGLIAMRERVDLLGGSLRYGPRADGGFTVAAAIPLPVTTHA